MKSGSNQFHGSGYDYFVNEILNAGTPFTDAGLTDSRRAGQHIRNDQRRNNQGDRWGRDARDNNRLSDQQHADWRRREEQSWRQRQNDFRRRDDDRQRQWQQRQQYLQQMRRMNQWRFQQQYWERLQRDRIRLQSFSYYDYGDPIYSYSRSGS